MYTCAWHGICSESVGQSQPTVSSQTEGLVNLEFGFEVLGLRVWRLTLGSEFSVGS